MKLILLISPLNFFGNTVANQQRALLGFGFSVFAFRFLVIPSGHWFENHIEWWRLRQSSEPRTVVLEYPARWAKPRIDLDELAKLRQAGWRTKQLSERFRVGLTTVKRASAKLRSHDERGV